MEIFNFVSFGGKKKKKKKERSRKRVIEVKTSKSFLYEEKLLLTKI